MHNITFIDLFHIPWCSNPIASQHRQYVEHRTQLYQSPLWQYKTAISNETTAHYEIYEIATRDQVKWRKRKTIWTSWRRLRSLESKQCNNQEQDLGKTETTW